MHSDTMRRQAIKMYANGAGFRQVARHLEIVHVTVMNWVKAHADPLPVASVPAEKPLHIVAMGALYPFVGKKNGLYLVTFVERKTSCIVGGKSLANVVKRRCKRRFHL